MPYGMKGIIAAIYDQAQCVKLEVAKGTKAYIVNATPADSVIIDCANAPASIKSFDVQGQEIPVKVPAALDRVPVAPSGLIELGF